VLKGTKAFPSRVGTLFRLISNPPSRPEVEAPPGGGAVHHLREWVERNYRYIPGMGDHFESTFRHAHSDTIDLDRWFVAR